MQAPFDAAYDALMRHPVIHVLGIPVDVVTGRERHECTDSPNGDNAGAYWPGLSRIVIRERGNLTLAVQHVLLHELGHAIADLTGHRTPDDVPTEEARVQRFALLANSLLSDGDSLATLRSIARGTVGASVESDGGSIGTVLLAGTRFDVRTGYRDSDTAWRYDLGHQWVAVPRSMAPHQRLRCVLECCGIVMDRLLTDGRGDTDGDWLTAQGTGLASFFLCNRELVRELWDHQPTAQQTGVAS